MTVSPIISPKWSFPDSSSSTPSTTAISMGPVRSGAFSTDSDLFRVITVRIFSFMDWGSMPRSA